MFKSTPVAFCPSMNLEMLDRLGVPDLNIWNWGLLALLVENATSDLVWYLSQNCAKEIV